MNKIVRSQFLHWLFLLLLSACTSVQFAPSKLNQVYPKRTSPQAIELFRSSSPTKKFFEIGAAAACCSGDANSMIDLLRNQASESGGDALIGLEINAHGGASATVIRYE
jgi:hypothetical protein